MAFRIFALCLMLISGAAFAQSCPEGIPSAGNPQCLPPTAENSPYYQGDSLQPVVRPVRWIDRWGAIASDDKGHVGVATELPNASDAQAVAIRDCQNKGGVSCMIDRKFKNQCAAMVVNHTSSSTANAPFEGQAIRDATDLCRNGSSDKCWVYWSGCSLPVQAQ